MLKRLGQILGVISSVAIFVSVFLSFESVGYDSFSLFSMNMIQYNEKGALVMLGIAVLGFLSALKKNGFLTGIFGILALVAMVFFCTRINTGFADLDNSYNLLNSYFGEIFRPGIGFLVAIAGFILLFLAGVLMNKETKKEKQSK